MLLLRALHVTHLCVFCCQALILDIVPVGILHKWIQCESRHFVQYQIIKCNYNTTTLTPERRDLTVATLDDDDPLVQLFPRMKLNPCPRGSQDWLYAGEQHLQLQHPANPTTPDQVGSSRFCP